MHCQLMDKPEAIEIFKQIFSSPQVTAEPIIECFNILVSNKLYDVALGLGGHLLKACEKFLVDVAVQKRFLLKFLFVFDHMVANTDETTDPKQTEQIITQLVVTLTKLVTLEFLTKCTQEEVKVIFYSIWNLAYEAKERGLIQESRQMLQTLYEQVKKLAQYIHENSKQKPLFDETVLRQVLFRTLSLLADMNLSLKNFAEARKAIRDLEMLQRNDADTYILKLRVLLSQSFQ